MTADQSFLAMSRIFVGWGQVCLLLLDGERTRVKLFLRGWSVRISQEGCFSSANDAMHTQTHATQIYLTLCVHVTSNTHVSATRVSLCLARLAAWSHHQDKSAACRTNTSFFPRIISELLHGYASSVGY